MQNCTYMGDQDSCKKWTDQPLEFDFDRVYYLCKDYIKLCKDYNELKQTIKEYPNSGISMYDSTYQFFFNCILNDLHREMSLWKTKR